MSSPWRHLNLNISPYIVVCCIHFSIPLMHFSVMASEVTSCPRLSAGFSPPSTQWDQIQEESTACLCQLLLLLKSLFLFSLWVAVLASEPSCVLWSHIPPSSLPKIAVFQYLDMKDMKSWRSSCSALCHLPRSLLEYIFFSVFFNSVNFMLVKLSMVCLFIFFLQLHILLYWRNTLWCNYVLHYVLKFGLFEALVYMNRFTLVNIDFLVHAPKKKIENS